MFNVYSHTDVKQGSKDSYSWKSILLQKLGLDGNEMSFYWNNCNSDNYIKTSMFSALCKDRGVEHLALVFYYEVRWLSPGKILQHEMKI